MSGACDLRRWLQFEVDRIVSAGVATISSAALSRLLAGDPIKSLSSPVPLRYDSAENFATSSDGWDGPFVGGVPLPKHVAAVRRSFENGPGVVEADGRTYSSLAELEEYARAVACSDSTKSQSAVLAHTMQHVRER